VTRGHLPRCWQLVNLFLIIRILFSKFILTFFSLRVYSATRRAASRSDNRRTNSRPSTLAFLRSCLSDIAVKWTRSYTSFDVVICCTRLNWRGGSWKRWTSHLHCVVYCTFSYPPSLDLASSEQWCWSGGILTELSLTMFPLPEFTARVHGPWTLVHFLTPVLTARVDGCQKMHPSSGNRAL